MNPKDVENMVAAEAARQASLDAAGKKYRKEIKEQMHTINPLVRRIVAHIIASVRHERDMKAATKK